MSNMLVSDDVWHSEHSPLVLKKCWLETEDTASFLFAEQNRAQFDFKAGQFVNVSVEINGKKEYRAYSISSIPGDKYLQLTIKRVVGGKVSNWLIDNLQPGDQLNTIGIAGQFNLNDCQYGQRILLLSAGCGITPVMSMARTFLSASSDIDIDFLHCARDHNNIIYHNEIKALDEKYKNFRCQFLLENALDENEKEPEQLIGRINKEKLDLLCTDWQQRTIFLCGPTAFMEAVNAVAQQANFNMSHFHQESFIANTLTELQAPSVEGTTEKDVVSVVLPSFNYKAEVAQGSTLLDALEQGGIPIIAACRQGICGSCKCKVTQGKVDSLPADVLTEAERNQGWVLACSSTVEGDIEVSLS
ncbi:hybrid-cluster NAD(P)-dependent oxidoreductase [Zooshikella ganghwensis]|nr:hybrid-cluster NAD(P)-dependent oxidoreductase [Zooshikella ganghwensis]